MVSSCRVLVGMFYVRVVLTFVNDGAHSLQLIVVLVRPSLARDIGVILGGSHNC